MNTSYQVYLVNGDYLVTKTLQFVDVGVWVYEEQTKNRVFYPFSSISYITEYNEGE